MEKLCDFRATFLILLIASVSLFLLFSGETSVFRLANCPVGFDRTNISHVQFGIGGSAKTWATRRQYIESWWKPNLTRGYLWLDREPTGYRGSKIPYRVSENRTRFGYSASAVRISRIVLESFRVGLPGVRWFVMGDDDTIFFTENLVSVLAKYDHRRMYYIGASSESIEQNARHSFHMAFGGGGFAVSHALAAELAKRLDGCVDRYAKFYGSDERVWACVAEIGVTLTVERGFHQMDIRGDAYGLLAAHPLAALVSLHHLDYLKPLYPTRTRDDSLRKFSQAYRADPGRILQQSFCFDGRRNMSAAVSWGYTVRVYPSLIPAVELEKPVLTFKTWRSWSDGPFGFNTQTRSPDPCQQPAVFFMDRVAGVREGSSLTRYTRFVTRKGNKCKQGDYVKMMRFQKIVVSAPKMDLDVWSMAPRRDCCEMASRAGKEGTLRMRIRPCEEGI